MRTVRDIVFAERPGFRPLSLDLHLPLGDRPPVIVFVHGGGWRTGSRRVMTPGRPALETFGRLTAHGWAVASIDYRLSGEAVFPAQLDDVLAAVSWVGSVGAAEFALDVERIAGWGESAGGHLVALAALTPGTPFRAVVDWYGPSDLTVFPDPDDPVDGPTREQALLGGRIDADPERARAASPLHRVHGDAPPFLLAHGSADRLVPPSQTTDFAARLREAGVPCSVQLVRGADHVWRGLDDLDEVVEPALAFLDAHVPPAPGRGQACGAGTVE